MIASQRLESLRILASRWPKCIERTGDVLELKEAKKRVGHPLGVLGARPRVRIAGRPAERPHPVDLAE